jgi:hypothetical protein
MTVHSPPSTSLGTRRSDDVMKMDLLGVFKSLRNVLTVHSPPSTSLGTRRAAWFGEIMPCRALLRKDSLKLTSEFPKGLKVDVWPVFEVKY